MELDVAVEIEPEVAHIGSAFRGDDRKSPRISARDLADALIGFANAEGGTIVIGLWSGKVEGIAAARAKQLPQWQQAALDFSTPAVPCKTRIVECVNDGCVERRAE